MEKETLLVTGGLGYIGSHTVLVLMRAGHTVHIVDNLSNSEITTFSILAREQSVNLHFHEVSVTDKSSLQKIFEKIKPTGVMHFAGVKSVSESNHDPAKYYKTNTVGTLHVLECMELFDCNKIIFSSSATVYNKNSIPPFNEEDLTGPQNPYGNSKLASEMIIQDWTKTKNSRSSIILRYFNPVGSHEQQIIGESPSNEPTNLMPIVTGVAKGKYPQLRVFGSSYETRDGTGERDYIHVQDLANAHSMALDYATKNHGCDIFNIGTGVGTTVLELVKIFERTTGQRVNFEIAQRREGDLASAYADVSKANKILGWKAQFDIEDMCRHAWEWEKKS